MFIVFIMLGSANYLPTEGGILDDNLTAAAAAAAKKRENGDLSEPAQIK